jgi:hypothetical protein
MNRDANCCTCTTQQPHETPPSGVPVPETAVHPLNGQMVTASDETREQRQAKQCRAKHPTNDSVVPCCLSPGHDSDHWSTTGCPGSAMLWPATVCVRLDGLADKIGDVLADAWYEVGQQGKRERLAASIVALLQSLAVQ